MDKVTGNKLFTNDNTQLFSRIHCCCIVFCIAVVCSIFIIHGVLPEVSRGEHVGGAVPDHGGSESGTENTDGDEPEPRLPVFSFTILQDDNAQQQT